MSIIRNPTNLPSDAIPIDINDATVKQWEMVYDWRPRTDVWAIRFATYLTSGLNAAAGLYINQYYRKKLKLAGYGFTVSFLPIVFMPAILGGVLHRQFITTRILLMDEPCPVCTQMRALAIQASTGILYPIILGPMTNYMLASRYDIARIPIIHVETKKWWAFHKKTSRQLYGVMSYFTLVNVLVTSLITYYEFKNVINVNEKLEKAEKWHSLNKSKILKEN